MVESSKPEVGKAKKPKMNKSKKRLVISILVVAICVLLYPLFLWLYYQFFHPKIDGTPYHNAAAQQIPVSTKPGNRLVVPDLGIDAEILESPDLTILDKKNGVWHDGKDKVPYKDGNVVIAGHRFRYFHHISNFFYNLPKIKHKQYIYVIWDKKVYEYQVYQTMTVTPDRVEIRNDDPSVPRKLTLYTCTLLGSNLDRFVVYAKMTEPKE